MCVPCVFCVFCSRSAAGVQRQTAAGGVRRRTAPAHPQRFFLCRFVWNAELSVAHTLKTPMQVLEKQKSIYSSLETQRAFVAGDTSFKCNQSPAISRFHLVANGPNGSELVLIWNEPFVFLGELISSDSPRPPLLLWAVLFAVASFIHLFTCTLTCMEFLSHPVRSMGGLNQVSLSLSY